VDLLRQAQRRHPGDFWISIELAFHLFHWKPPQLLEAFRFYYRAARPSSSWPEMSSTQLLEAIGFYRAALVLRRRARART
jgi:hypothetical protein